MFKRSFSSKERVDRVAKGPTKKSFVAKQRLADRLDGRWLKTFKESFKKGSVVSIMVGKEGRHFACHEDLLCRSPYLRAACEEAFFDGNAKRISVVDEDPATFSCVLEYLYRGDYTPRMLHDRRNNHWYIERLDDSRTSTYKDDPDVVIHHSLVGDNILRDTAVYCAAERYGLEELKRLALRKQTLHTNLKVAIILRSAQYAYANTPDNDTAIRSHFLLLIIRGHKTFARSGTMQQQMELGGKMWFDLFAAMSSHLDDLQSARGLPGLQSLSGTPRTI